MNPSTIEAAALFKLGKLASEDLPAVAERALIEGYDCPTLSLLLVETETENWIVGPLFEKCISELGLDTLSKDQIYIRAAGFYAKQVLAGEMQPVTFGFELGNFGPTEELPQIIRSASQQAMWYDEAPNEEGYPEDWQSFQEKCIEQILALASELANQ